MRYGGIRDHRAATMVGYHPSDDRNSDCKGDKHPTSGVNLRRVFRITALNAGLSFETSTLN
jgi:hypothetical protein